MASPLIPSVVEETRPFLAVEAIGLFGLGLAWRGVPIGVLASLTPSMSPSPEPQIGNIIGFTSHAHICCVLNAKRNLDYLI